MLCSVTVFNNLTSLPNSCFINVISDEGIQPVFFDYDFFNVKKYG